MFRKLRFLMTADKLTKGTEELEPSVRRTALEQSIREVVPTWFEDRILPVTRRIAERWGFSPPGKSAPVARLAWRTG